MSSTKQAVTWSPTGNNLFRETVLTQGNDFSRNVWEFLSVTEMYCLPLLSKTIRRRLEYIEYNQCQDGRTYQVPFPGYPGVAAVSTPSNDDAAGLSPSQLACLRAMEYMENRRKDYGALRGGILGIDTPSRGTTKTTILALMASTAGARPTPVPAGETDAICEEGWKWRRKHPDFAMDILKAIRPFLLWIEEHLEGGGDLSNEQKKMLLDELKPPFTDSHFDTIQKMESFLQRCMHDMRISRSVREHVRQNVLELKSSLDKRRRKGRHSCEVDQRQDWERTLIPSSGTLIVVPEDAAVKAWGLHLLRNMKLTLFADHSTTEIKDGVPRGLVYLDGYGDLIDVVLDSRTHHSMTIPRRADLPRSWELEKYLIVVTSFDRCRGAMKLEEQTKDRIDSNRRRKRSRDFEIPWTKTSPLLQLRWLRLVVEDAGQSLTRTEGSTDVTRFVNLVAAERRWVVCDEFIPAVVLHRGNACVPDPLEGLKRHLLVLRHPTYGNSIEILEMDPGDQAKYLLSTNDDQYDEVMSHQQMLRHIDRDPKEERFWTFERLDAHEGPLTSEHPRYNGCPWNVRVVWQGGVAKTWEPLSTLAKDDPMSCAAYAREHKLLNVDGWEFLRGVTHRCHNRHGVQEGADGITKTSLTTFLDLQEGLWSKIAQARDAMVSLLQEIMVINLEPVKGTNSLPLQQREDPFCLSSIYRQVRPPKAAVEIVHFTRPPGSHNSVDKGREQAQ